MNVPAIIKPSAEIGLDLPYFNYSCLPWHNGWLFAGRNAWSPQASLRLVLTDKSYHPRESFELPALPAAHDARLFTEGNILYCLYSTRIKYYKVDLILARLEEKPEGWELTNSKRLPHLRSLEKNWIFHDDYIFYDPDRQVILDRDFRIIHFSQRSGLRLKGGTNFVPFGDFLIGCCHSHHPHENRRAYQAFLVALEAKYPFKRRAVLQIDPLLVDRYPKTDMSDWIRDRIQSVIFPMSIHRVADAYHVSAGINDSANVMLVFDDATLERGLYSALCRSSAGTEHESIALE